MTIVFMGGSRSISRLPPVAKWRIDNAIDGDMAILVGDANGADKAIQRHLQERNYRSVNVYCVGDECRNNVGEWEVKVIAPPRARRDHRFFGAKDEAMAAAADYGLMLWDGDSPGTLLNVARLAYRGKPAIFWDASRHVFVTVKSWADWQGALARMTEAIRTKVAERWEGERSLADDLFAA